MAAPGWRQVLGAIVPWGVALGLPFVVPREAWNACAARTIAWVGDAPQGEDDRAFLLACVAAERARANRAERALATLSALPEPLPGAGAVGPSRVVPAEVVARFDATGGLERALLDRGSEAGIREGQAVLAGPALVGRIIWASDGTAVVAGVRDPAFRLAATDERSGAAGLVLGSASDLVFRSRFPVADLAPGDAILSAARSPGCPAGFVIGTVIAVTRTSRGEPEARLAPAQDLRDVRTVAVVTRPASAGGLSEGAVE